MRATRGAPLLRQPPVPLPGFTFAATGRPLGLRLLDLSPISYGGSNPRHKRPATHHRRQHRSSRTPTTHEPNVPCPRSTTPAPRRTPRVHVPILMRPWVLHTCHSATSWHLGVSRTLITLRRCYWWIGMDISARWWLRHCLKGQACKTSRHKQFAGLPFPCRYPTAPASSSTWTTSAPYP